MSRPLTRAPLTPDPVPAPPPADRRPARLDPLTYDVAGLADALGCSERHVWRMHAAGHLPGVGRLVRWPRKAIDAWLAAGCPARPAVRAKSR